MWRGVVLSLVIGALCYTSDAYSECYRWTKWLNRDLPSGSGDYETFRDFRKLTPPPVCANPVGIECRTVGSHVNHTQNGETYDCDLWAGGVCRNADQSDRRCDNYEVRFLCPCGSISSNFLESSSQQCRWSSYDDRDNPSGFGDYETIRDIRTPPCTSSEDVVGIQCVSLSGQDFRQTGAVRYHCNQRSGGYCVNSEQNGGYCKDYKVRYLCCPRAPTPPPVETCYQWTKWLNRDLPSGTGDYETFHDFRKLTPPPVCANPVGIECRTVGSHVNHTQNGEVYDCDLWAGGVCRNADQSDRRCDNYEVRFLCSCGSISSNFLESSSQQCRWSSYDDRDNPSGFGDYETIRDIRTPPCTSSEDRLGIQCVSLSGQDFRLTGAVRYHCNQRSGGYCVNSEQNGGYCKDYKVRHLCCPRAPTPPPVELCYQWTKWLNRDLPSGTGDYETFHDFRKLTVPPVCANPVAIECRTVGSHISHIARGETYSCEVSSGGVCRNADQSDRRCDNYEVRFLCPCDSISDNLLVSPNLQCTCQ